MSTTNPIAGNQYFTRVVNSAKKFTELDTTNLVASRIHGPVVNTVIGYSTSAMSAAGNFAFANKPGLASVSSDADAVILPANILPTLVYFVNTSTTTVAGGACTVGAASTLNAAPTNAFTGAVTATNINGNCVAAVAAIAAAGGDAAGVTDTSVVRLNCTIGGSGTTGVFQVIVQYIQLTPESLQ